MNVYLVIRTTGGSMIEKGLSLKDYNTIVVDVLEKIPELNDVIRDIKYGRLLIGHGSDLIHLDTEFTKLLEVDSDYFTPQEIEEDFVISSTFDDTYQKLVFGLINNKDLQ